MVAVTQAVLEGMGRPLLCTSVHVAEHIDDTTEVPDVGSMLESYDGKGLDFIIDVGKRVATVSSVRGDLGFDTCAGPVSSSLSLSLSQVVDMTGDCPEIVRVGRGDVSVFE